MQKEIKKTKRPLIPGKVENRVTEKVKHGRLGPKIVITLFIAMISTSFILNKKGILTFENPVAFVVLGLIIGLFVLYLIVLFKKSRKGKKTELKEKEKEVIQKIRKEVMAKASKYETDIDILYHLIDEVGSLTLIEVAEGFGISKEEAEEWAKMLESHGMIEINYPTIGDMILCKKKSKNTE